MTAIKPKRSPFLFARISVALTMLSVLFMGAAVAEIPALTGIGGLIWLGGGALAVGWSLVAWKKEHYEIHPHHLVRHSGGLFSDHTTEL